MSRRLEGIRFDPPAPNSLQEVGRSGAAFGKTIERRPLKGVAPKKNLGGTAEAEASQPSQPETHSLAHYNDRSLDAVLTDLVRPQIADLSILRRASLLLSECADFFDHPEEDDPVPALAVALIRDEIGRHRDLASRLQQGAQADDVT